MGDMLVGHGYLMSFSFAPEEAPVKADDGKVSLSLSLYPAFFPPPQSLNTVKAFSFHTTLPEGFVATPARAL